MDQDNEPTSDYEGSIAASEFTTARTSHLRYWFESGRRYQGLFLDRYGLPNDDIEQMREGIKHTLYLDYLHDGKLLLAPIGDHPQKIVDLGTGFGFWVQDVAERYESARVIGTDISPIQPKWAPPNCEFHVEDLEDEERPWTTIYSGADLIHIRSVIPILRDPQRLIHRSFENLRSGGWIECHEIVTELRSDDGTVTADHPLNAMYRQLKNGPFSARYGWSLEASGRIPEMMEAAGFVNIKVQHNKVPLGRWGADTRAREMGLFCRTICEDLLVALTSRHAAMGLSEEEATQLTCDFYQTSNDTSIHGWMDWIDVWAQKP
ncbi:Methyltransferase domain [Geosmithia morbida]|uniref:Methyltransferase domain n=1 Tax=Geosmithia morbida TaxID=1094350 RepID=A0A9P5D868_9HYPO|nr:Methyltransferase domain [Geosmithia morbida]KAF4126485.1 Methyltransferase domain [Geosmithia morbida]